MELIAFTTFKEHSFISKLKTPSLSVLRPIIPFLIGLGLAILLASFFPALVASGGPLHTEYLTGFAVLFIFLIQGLQLPVDQMKRGLTAWPVHLFSQGWMFLVSPLLAFLLMLALGSLLNETQRIALFYLSILPTTVATNATYTAKAGGNTAVAVFNIVLGNFLGVLVCPALLAIALAHGANVAVSPWPLLLTLSWQLLLPFLLGQLLRPRLNVWISGNSMHLRNLSSYLIFFIVFVSISNLLAGKNGQFSWQTSGIVLVSTLLLLAVSKIGCWQILRRLPWPHDQKIAAFYAGSQKSLVSGLPMAGAVYAATAGTAHSLPPLALIILPLIIYHVAQLIIGALLIPVLSSTATETS